MYPPRSGNRQGKRQHSRRRRRRVWAWVNVALLLLITAALAYSFMDGKDPQGSAAPPAALVTSPSPEAAATAAVPTEAVPTEEAPGTEATATAEPAPEGTPEASPVPTETAAAATTATAAPTPSPAKQTEATNAPQATTGSSSGLVAGLPENTSGGTVKLSFAGDIIFSGKAGALLEQKGYDYSYSALDGMFKKDDLTVVNLETPITTRGVGAKNKQFVFKGPPKALDALKAAGVDAVNLANNHTLDQGEEGLLDTLKHLGERGIPHVGGRAE
ncbi:CapA family protein [Paenibacillus rhizoplanae]